MPTSNSTAIRRPIALMTIVGVTALAAVQGRTQTSMALIEACNAVPQEAKRLECLKAAMNTAPQTAAPNANDSLRKAFADIQSSLDVGISYNNYQTALLELAKAVAAFKEGPAGDAAKNLATEALEAYKDAGTFWERAISFYARSDNNLAFGGGLPVGLTGMDWLVSKYSLQTVRSDLLGLHAGLPVAGTRSRLWEIAASKASSAVSPQPQTKNAEDQHTEEITLVEAAAKERGCNDTPKAISAGRVSDANEYIVACSNGLQQTYSCQFNICSLAR